MGLRKAAKKMVIAACASFSRKQALVDPSVLDSNDISNSAAMSTRKGENISEYAEKEALESTNTVTSKNLCAICLDPLSYSTGTSPGQAIFTAQCSHAFHFACISSNVRHGSVTCPICRAHWTQLPRALNPPFSLSCHRPDPILRILDDSIANFRVHRRSFLQSARYDDDDPVDPEQSSSYPRLDFVLVPVPPLNTSIHSYGHGHGHYRPCGGMSSSHNNHIMTSSSSLFHQLPQQHYARSSHRAYLSVKLAHQQATDLVLVANPNGPHLRLLKQALALVVFSLRPIDRLAIVTYSSAAARIFPLRRMTSNGKRAALQVIDRLFYMGQADPTEGLKKGVKILEDRVHKNPQSCILHLSDSPTRLYHPMSMDAPFPVPVHQFHVGFGFGASNGFVMHEFEKFIARMLGGMVRELQLRIGEDGTVVRIGELRGGEERRVLLDLYGDDHVYVGYSYAEGGADEDECVRTGEAVVGVGDKREIGTDCVEGGGRDAGIVGGRMSSVESWDYHDPYMARRWAKHLHGYRL